MKGKRGDLRIIGIAMLVVILLSGFALAILAFPNGTTDLRVTTCSAEDQAAASDTFAGVCQDTTGSRLNFDDGLVENHSYHKQGATRTYAGVRIQSVNATVTNCQSIQQVILCYEAWRPSTSTPGPCKVAISNDSAATILTVNTTCPGSVVNPGAVCMNVTSNLTWSCNNFFGASGSRAAAEIEVFEGGGANLISNLTVDFLFFNVTYTANTAPVINNVTISSNLTAGGSTLTIYANTTINGVNDTEANTLNLYCDTTSTPTAANTDCTGGTTSDSSYPYDLTCTFAAPQTNANNTEFCRVYDGSTYSSTVPSINFTTDSTVPTTFVIAVAGDEIPSYFDTVNDGITVINVSGESGMSCRWSSSDLAYSSMTNVCTVIGNKANCSITDAVTQGLLNRYVACQDSLGNGQNSTQNLDISFYLDYTAPTTTDNSVSTIQVPSYVVTLTESDNVDSDPTSFYCTSSSAGCTPVTSIDNGGTITYTSANRGANYLRYYSVDDAGNTQSTVSKTININQLPIFTSASDGAATIKGGTTVNVSTLSYDLDSSQTLSLFVCSSSGATSSGCNVTEYCSSSGAGNLSCTFTSESDSSTHTWYAYIFDQVGEAASANPLTGSYVTDTTAPTITIVSPLNNTNISQSSLTFSISADEILSWAAYSINWGENVTMTNNSLLDWAASNTSIANGNYNLTFYANDSYNNLVMISGYSFKIDTTLPDTTPPTITIWSPQNGSYNLDGVILLNITSDENLSWAAFANDSNALRVLENISRTNWNTTIELLEGQHNITFYANDTSGNQVSLVFVVYVDLNNPGVSAFSCTDANDSINVVCNASLSDAIGLDYAIISYNATGVWQNSSQIDLSGVSDSLSYLIDAGNTTPPDFTAQIYLYDLSGRANLTEYDHVVVSDDKFPGIFNISYSPNRTEELDSGVRIRINATIVEDYSIGNVILMIKNSSSNWAYITMSNLSQKSAGAAILYNASFLPGDEDWQFRINATDSAGNQNLSAIYSFIVANESSFVNYTTIPDIKSITYSQRIDNNTLGIILLNNTGDDLLEFNITINSSISSRFNINYTFDDNSTYQLSSGENESLIILVNTTGLTAGLYPYNITIMSAVGNTVYEKQLNIQTANGPYLVTTINTYSASVTKGQSGVLYSASITNLGTQEATDAYLDWTLPTEFTLVSGNLSRSLGTISIGGSGSNTITISVSSSTEDKYVNVTAVGNASNADSSSDQRQVAIGSPTIVQQVVNGGTTGSSSGGSFGGSGAGGAVYSKIEEVVRGDKLEFYVEVENKYSNITINDVILNLTGFPEQYVKIEPSYISIGYKKTGRFKVTVSAPSYKESYEEKPLKVYVKGMIYDGANTRAYSETQNILLIIEEVSHDDTNSSLIDARAAIELMKNKNYSVAGLENLLSTGERKLSIRRNKEAYDIAQQILDTKKKAFETKELIDLVYSALDNPKLTQKAALTGNVIFDNQQSRSLVDLAYAAFQRGDYDTAYQRIKEAQSLLLLDRQSNPAYYVYLYWPYMLIGLVAAGLLLTLGYRRYQKNSISDRIKSLNKKEENILDILRATQRKYLSGKISAAEYHSKMNLNQSELGKVKRDRLKLRNTRVKRLKAEQLTYELNLERQQVENELKKLQEAFYNKNTISEKDYELQFKLFNERLAEIEDERAVLEVIEEKKKFAGKYIIFKSRGKKK